MGSRRRWHARWRSTSTRHTRAPWLRRTWRGRRHRAQRNVNFRRRLARTALTQRRAKFVHGEHALVVPVALTTYFRNQTQSIVGVTKAQHLELIEQRHWRQ